MTVTYSCDKCGVKYPYDRRLIGKPSHRCAKRMGHVYELKVTEEDQPA